MIMEIPIDRILTETDGPFTASLGRPSVPSDVSDAIDILARFHRKSSYEFSSIVRANLKKLLTQS